MDTTDAVASTPGPAHVGYIVDGNRRWAKSHGLPTYEGHLAGYNTLKSIIFETFNQGVEYVSIYAFSTENWKRDEGETGKLMKLAMTAFRSDLSSFIERGIRIRVLGTPDGLEQKMIDAAHKAEDATKDLGQGGTLCICFNYGGTREIVDATRALIADGLQAEDITEQAITERLYAPEVPPVDLVVRTSGEHRLSNFMLWRVAYAEFIFVDKFWPSLTNDDITDILSTYKQRARRFGG